MATTAMPPGGSDESGRVGGDAVLDPRTPLAAVMTIELYVIARLDVGDAAADVYTSEVHFSHAVDGAFCGRATTSWSRSLRLAPDTSVDLDGLDRTLVDAGYYRTSGWRARVTASGAVRYFADAAVGIGDTSHSASRASS
ncbi:hypothetical protein ACFVJ5_07390 [Nocardia sp. NPDC127606]|uniref:hypothetical protein n=1 Tax=Nocardia sp. NPDC127606 TaxID=3345406 RepID=UPI003643D553